jgi:hypothetical protein
MAISRARATNTVSQFQLASPGTHSLHLRPFLTFALKPPTAIGGILLVLPALTGFYVRREVSLGLTSDALREATALKGFSTNAILDNMD